MAMTPVVSQILRGKALWTPARSVIKPRIHIDARDAVWSGSNLTSINARGLEAGAMTVGGTPTQGTVSNGIFPILTDATTEVLTRTLAASSTGKVSCFWFGKAAAIVSQNNGLFNREWNSSDATNTHYSIVLYGQVDGATGSLFIVKQQGTGTQSPIWETNDLISDTTSYFSIYGQVGTTNLGYKNGQIVAFSGSGSTPAAVNTLLSYAWEFGRGACAASASPGETSNAAHFTWAIFDNFLPISEVQKWEGYYRHLTNQKSELPASHPYKSRPPRV